MNLVTHQLSRLEVPLSLLFCGSRKHSMFLCLIALTKKSGQWKQNIWATLMTMHPHVDVPEAVMHACKWYYSEIKCHEKVYIQLIIVANGMPIYKEKKISNEELYCKFPFHLQDTWSRLKASGKVKLQEMILWWTGTIDLYMNIIDKPTLIHSASCPLMLYPLIHN